jgi:hypothetical protein
MLMNFWRDKAMRLSGTTSKLFEVPVYVEDNGEYVKITDIKLIDDKIVLIKETNEDN